MALQLRALDPDDGCRALSLGDEVFTPLKTFLAREAKKLHKENLAKTFVLVIEGQRKVQAYITLLCTHVTVQQFSAPLNVEGGFKYKDYPALKVARLAVNRALQGSGAGSALVDFAIGLAVDHIMPNAGCRFLVLDAKSESTGFYEKKGFTKMGAVADGGVEHTAMFMDLHKLRGYAPA